MSHTTSISQVGDKLIVGQIDTSFLTATSRVTPGTSVLNGPVYIGATGQIGVARATCMIGPPLGSLSVPASLEVTGVTNIVGSLNVFAISLFTGVTTKNGTTIKNALSLKNGVDLKNAVNIGNGVSIDNSNGYVAGVLTASDVVTAGGSLNVTHTIAAKALALAGKGFDIPHPTKENHRLRYICLEGPEVGAYFRGTLRDSNIIQLPEYWRELVYPDTITVNLTPIGQYQELLVETINWGTQIKIKNNLGSSIHCYYTVFAERKTIDKLQTEYRGLTPNDYPGDNSEYALGGWDYAVHKGEIKSSGL